MGVRQGRRQRQWPRGQRRRAKRLRPRRPRWTHGGKPQRPKPRSGKPPRRWRRLSGRARRLRAKRWRQRRLGAHYGAGVGVGVVVVCLPLVAHAPHTLRTLGRRRSILRRSVGDMAALGNCHSRAGMLAEFVCAPGLMLWLKLPGPEEPRMLTLVGSGQCHAWKRHTPLGRKTRYIESLCSQQSGGLRKRSEEPRKRQRGGKLIDWSMRCMCDGIVPLFARLTYCQPAGTSNANIFTKTGHFCWSVLTILRSIVT